MSLYRNHTMQNQGLQFINCFREICQRQPVAVGDCVEINRQIAHKTLNDIAAHSIFALQFDTTCYRQFAGRYGIAVGRHTGDILNVALRQ